MTIILISIGSLNTFCRKNFSCKPGPTLRTTAFKTLVFFSSLDFITLNKFGFFLEMFGIISFQIWIFTFERFYAY